MAKKCKVVNIEDPNAYNTKICAADIRFIKANIDFLMNYNAWRKGEINLQPNPALIGCCLDNVVRILNSMICGVKLVI